MSYIQPRYRAYYNIYVDYFTASALGCSQATLYKINITVDDLGGPG